MARVTGVVACTGVLVVGVERRRRNVPIRSSQGASLTDRMGGGGEEKEALAR